MRINSSFTKKIEMPLNIQLTNELEGIAGLAACAGIRNNWRAARKARGNHYGEFMAVNGQVYQIPVRQYVWAATRDRVGKAYGEEIKKIIMKGIHDNPMPHTQKTEDRSINGVIKQVAIPKSGKHGTPVFAGRNGYEGLMRKIALQMEINQFNAIEEVNIVGKKHNADSTIKRKGKDHPLVDTGKMQMAIESWVE